MFSLAPLVFFLRIGSAVLTFIGYKQTDRQAKFIYLYLYFCFDTAFYQFLETGTSSSSFSFTVPFNIKEICKISKTTWLVKKRVYELSKF